MAKLKWSFLAFFLFILFSSQSEAASGTDGFAPRGVRSDRWADVMIGIDLPRDGLMIQKDRPEATFSVRGKITDPNGKPVPEVLVEVTGYARQSMSSADGSYLLKGLVKGQYEIRPQKLDCTFTPPSRLISISRNMTGQDFVAHCPSTVYLALVVKSFPYYFSSVSPLPPACLLRNSPDLNDRLLIINGGLPTTGHSLQFRRADDGGLSIHFGMEVHWESEARISLDIADIKTILWQDKLLRVNVRITDSGLQPVSDWSDTFQIADDLAGCSAAGE